MSSAPPPAFAPWMATRIGPAQPVAFPGLGPALTWLDEGIGDPTILAELGAAARECLARFAHRDDLPVTVERWPLSRDRLYSVLLVSADRGVTQSLEIRLSPTILATPARAGNRTMGSPACR